jgi:hypothetical protein
MKPIFIWLALLVVAIILNSIRPTTSEDPRWVPNERPYYAHGEGIFYAWVLPALGVVWTFAQLLRVPQGERIGSARMIAVWGQALLGISVVLLTLMGYVSVFNPPDIGYFVAMFAWFSLALFIAVVSVLILITRAVQPKATSRMVGLIGSVAVLLIGWATYQDKNERQDYEALTGAPRAQALTARLDAVRSLLAGERAAGVGYRVFAADDRVDLEVAVPWPEADAAQRDRILAFWNQPREAVLFIPKPPWRAEWRTSSDPPALVFAIRQPADAWTINGLGSASNEAGFLAKAPWSELRPLTTTLIDEQLVPSVASSGQQQSREILQVALLRAALHLDRLANVCNEPTARTVAGLPAADVFRDTAARARGLRAALVKSSTEPSEQELLDLAEQLGELGNGQWQYRPDGCSAIYADDEYALGHMSDDIRKHAPLAR